MYENGSYRLLTQDKVTFNLEAEAYGTEDIMTQFHIYFSPSDNIEGFKLGKETISYEYNGNQKTVVVTTTFDAMMGCYCFSFQLPGGVTWSQQDFLYSGSQIGYPGRTSRGGDLIVWGEVMPVVNNETDDTQMPELQGNTDYMKLNWSTLRNLYEMEMQDQTNEADVNQTTHKPYFRYNYRINDKLKYRDNKIINNNAYRGKDPVTKIIRRFTVTLPEGMVWDQDDVNSRCANGSYPGKVIEFSEDNRTLVYDYTSTYNDYAAGLGGETFGLYFNNNSVIITDTYDFYSESKIKYTCKGTVYYMYSDPDEMQEAEGYETLPALKGDIVFDRSCRQNGETGRAKPITNYLKVINKGAKNASADLKSITDRPVNDNGYTNLSSDQIIALFREKNEYLEIQNITVEKVLLYQDGKDFKLGTVHTGCDGVTAVEENRLNTYSDPTYENAKFVYSINALDSNVLELSVLDSDSNEIAKKTFDLTKSDDTLANEIEAVYEEIGYFVPVGFYSVTWNATDKVKERILEPGEEWIIEQYDSTVKLDYVQAHHYFGGDSYVYFRFFGAYEPTARATFTVNNGENSTYDVDKYTYDKGYSSTLINMSAQYFNDEKGQFESMRASNELRPGDIICYTESYRNGNNAEISDIPFRQVMNSTQCVLAPCEKNTKLADGGYEKVTVQGKEYYLLEPTDLVQKLTGIWLGIDDNLYYTEEINIGQLESKDGKTKGGETVITWYDKTAAAFSNSETYHFRYQFYTYVLDPVREGYRPDSYCSFYANNYKSSKYSARLYYTINARYNGEVIAKNMVTNPEKFGTKEERINKDFRSSYIGIGESVTYRLEFMQFWTREYTLSQGMITDDLPNTSGSFEWKVGENVHVEYFLTNRVDTVDGSYGGDEYERFIPSDDNDFCTVKTKKARINDQGEEKDIDYLSWGEFKIPAGKVLYIYVTLDYPKDQTVWDDYVEKADTTIYNVFRWQTSKSVISHNIARPPRVFLKTGMLATAADPNGYLYANGDEVERTVTYYLVIYNHGKSDYYLNPVYFKIPEGFTLKNPPKWQGWNSVPDWNCYGVTVEDENPPVNNPQRIGVYVNAQVSEDKTEGVLKVRPSVDYKSRYDDRIGKYYLKPGEYVSIEMKFAVDTYLNTPDLADFPVAMPIDDSHHVGNICKVEGVDAHRSNDENANAGTPEFWESDEIAQSRGFKEPYPSDTGKWVASDLKLTRKEAKPGLIKSPPSNKLMSETVDSNGKTVLNIQPYDPQDGVAMEYPVQWETKLVNGGENALTDYRVKDTIQWPYCFDREVVLKSQYSAANDRSFKIDRFYKGADDDGNQILDRDRLKINNVEIQIAPDRATALDPDNIDIYSARIMGGKGRVYFYKEDTFGDGRDNETMELDFTGTREYGVAPQSYSNGKPVPATRTLSYWTKYDMSKSKVAPRTSYCNRMILQPQQPYTKGDVAEGIAIGKDGNPVTDSDVQPDGILSVAYVSVNSGQSTVAWMTVKENKSDGQQDDNLSDDIKDVLTRENKILLGDSRNTVTYTMNVMNHVGGDTDQGVVQNPDDRKYSLKDMVIINCLPRIGDRAPFDSRVPRDSDFAMSLAGEVKLFYEDKANSQQGNGSETQMERNLQPVSDEVYRILYSTKETMSATDWNLGGGSSWKNTKPDGWYTFDELESIGGIGKVRSIRIELHDPTTSFPSDESLRSQYRELMKSGRTIVAQYKANVSDSSEIDPGKCAWNSFGYRFNRFITANDETRIMEASSIRTGVQIPAIPILYQKLINFKKNPYVNEGDPQTFKFTIEKRSREQTSEDDTVTTIPAQVISFKVSVGTGKSSESQKLLDLEDAEIFDWKREDGDTRGFWEDGASYVVKQTENPEEFKFFSVTVNNQPTAEFIYNASYQPVIIYENQCIDWNGTLFKMDKESEGYDPINDADKVKLLPGALFALYTTDESQKINFDGLSGDKYIIYHENEELINKAAEVEVNFGGKDEPPTKLYLKDIDITGSKDSGMAGRINWIGLKDDTYYVRELVAPDGYYLNLNYLSITKAKSELIVYDVAGKELPESGGFGTMPIYAIGSILLLSGFVSVEIKRRKDRSDNN